MKNKVVWISNGSQTKESSLNKYLDDGWIVKFMQAQDGANGLCDGIMYILEKND
jgi:hypothetical protein